MVKKVENIDVKSMGRVSIEEMTEAYKEQSVFEPNRCRVGRFAKRNGFTLAKQMIDRKFHYFYVKLTLMNN